MGQASSTVNNTRTRSRSRSFTRRRPEEDGVSEAKPKAAAATAAAETKTQDNGKLQQERQQQVVSALRSMKKSPTNPKVQKKALAKLRSYCNSTAVANSKNCPDSSYSELLIKYNGLHFIMRAMRNHGKSKLVNHACRILVVLAKEEEEGGDSKTTIEGNIIGASKATTVAAAPLVLAAMRGHKRNVDVQYSALTALTQWGIMKGDEAVVETAKNKTDNKSNKGQEKAAPLKSRLPAIEIVEAGAFEVIWDAMENPKNEGNPILQDRALKALLALTSHSENRQAFVAARGWKVLQTTLKNHTSHEKIQIKALKVYRQIANDYPQAVAKKALTPILEVMSRNQDNPVAQRHGCSIILSLAAEENCRAFLWEPGSGRDAVLKAMQSHPKQEDIQKTGILALQRLPTIQQQQQQQQSDTNGSSRTTTAATITPATEGIQTATSPSRDIISIPSMDTGEAVNSGIEAMVTRLKDPTTTPATITNICKAWIRLSMASHTNKLDIAGAKGVEAIVQNMALHPKEASMQRYACQVLTQLASVEHNKKLLAKANGIPAVAQAIRNHSTTETHLVALHGIFALERISQLVENHDKIMACPLAVSSLVSAMRTYSKQVTIQQVAVGILIKLASSRYSSHRGYKESILKAGGVHAILLAMAEHSAHKNIQRNGCLGLMNVHNEKTSGTMVQAGALEAISTAMATQLHHIGVQMAAMRAISEITQYRHNLQYWVLSVDGLQQLVLSSRSHCSNSHLQELVFKLFLRSTQNKDPFLRMQLTRADGIPAILTCMKDYHPTHPCIQKTGFMALYNLSQNAYTGALIVNHGGWNTVRHAQQLCPDDPSLRKYCSTLLVRLTAMFFLHWLVWSVNHAHTIFSL